MANLATGIATVGQYLGLPELGISERISGTNTQTRPSYTGSGLFGSGGYVMSPVPGNSQVWPVNSGIAQGGPQAGQQVSYNPTPQNIAGNSSAGQTLGLSDHRSAGGGGAHYLTEGDALALGFDINNLPGGYARYQPNVSGEIDSAYGDASNILDQRRANLLSGEQDFYNAAGGQYDAERPLIQQAYNQGLALNTQQQGETQQNEANALSQARRLYNELSQGVHQRFGGSNSAGDFANAFYGREFARRMGDIQNTTGQNTQKLMQQRQSLEDKYQSNLQNLEQRKQSALAQARDEFRQRLDQIDAMKGQLAENKASMKLQELQNLRARAYQIEDQTNAFLRQLYLSHQQNVSGLQSDVSAYGQFANSIVPQTSYGQFSVPALGASSGGQQINATGQYTPTPNDYDLMKRMGLAR